MCERRSLAPTAWKPTRIGTRQPAKQTEPEPTGRPGKKEKGRPHKIFLAAVLHSCRTYQNETSLE